MKEDIYVVSFLGKDELGVIVKAIKIVANSQSHAIKLARELNSSTEIYSAIKQN